MKSKDYYKLLIAFLGLIFFHSNIFSQTITISPVLGYGHFKSDLQTVVGDKFFIYSSGNIDESNHIGLTARFYFKKDRFYIQPSFTYGDEASGHSYNIDNLDPQQNIFYDENGEIILWKPEYRYSSHSIPNRVHKTSLAIGGIIWKPSRLFALRGFTGLALDYRTSKNLEDNRDFARRSIDLTPEGFSVFPVDELRLAIYNAENSWILNGHIGLGIDIGKFWIDVAMHRSLTRLSQDLKYYDQVYDYKLHAQQLLFTIGWNITLRNKNQMK